MTTIRVSCPDCGNIDLLPANLTVRVCRDTHEHSYTFWCFKCRLMVCKQSNQTITDMLTSSGVRIRLWKLPDELFEIRTGAPISHDDLLDFHENFEQLVEPILDQDISPK